MRKSLLIRLLLLVTSVAVTLFALDNLLYFSSPVLPKGIVQSLSPEAQSRYVRVNPNAVPWIYAENIRYGKPYAATEDNTRMDALGYRNPANYLDQNKKLDVLLLGDSFVWGTEQRTIADYLRETLSPFAVYSGGMPGEGIPQWRYHYARIVSITGVKPGVVVLNYYSGNDLDNTQRFLAILRDDGFVDSKVYFGYTDEANAPQESGFSRVFALSELRHLAQIAFAVSPDKDGQKAALDGVSGPYDFYIRREEDPALLDDAVAGQIAMTVDEIRTTNVDTIIVLSYIPTSAALYGGNITNCPDCASDIETQKALSLRLKAAADKAGINYLDSTSALQAQAKTKALWRGAHFSAEGYQAYSELLAQEMQKVLPP